MLALAVSVCAIRRPLYVGICLSVLLPSLAGEAFAGAGGPAPRAGGPRRDDRALVTYVGGDVVVLAAKARGRRVEIGDELRSGTRLELGKSSQVTVLWTRGRSTTIRGPRRATVVAPPEPPKTRRTGSHPSVAANLWNAIRTRLRGLGRGRGRATVITAEPLAVRGPEDEWQMSPADECIVPGVVELRWRSPSEQGGEYSVVIWDAEFAQVWRGTAQTHEVEVPASVGFVPGQRYWWVVSPVAEPGASPLCWFEVLTAERLASLEQELRWAQDVFGEVSPPSQLHVGMGCVYQSHGLLSKARSEYQTAAELSPAYQVLVDELGRLGPPGRRSEPREETPRAAE